MARPRPKRMKPVPLEEPSLEERVAPLPGSKGRRRYDQERMAEMKASIMGATESSTGEPSAHDPEPEPEPDLTVSPSSSTAEEEPTEQEPTSDEESTISPEQQDGGGAEEPGDSPSRESPAPGPRYFRKVIRLRAEDSPNVRLALEEIAAGREPSGTIVTPGVLTWEEYRYRRKFWDPMRQCIGLDGQFWDGPETMLYPADWLNYSEQYADELKGKHREAEAMGVDTGQGKANTSLSIGDRFGLIHQFSKRTPNTNEIPGLVLFHIHHYNIPPEKVCIDIGGGGKECADRLRDAGYPVRTVGFGERPTPEVKRFRGQYVPYQAKIDDKERRLVYRNRRAEMYYGVRLLIDPNREDKCRFGIPAEYTELRRQMSMIPLMLDPNGVIYMPPKSKKSPKSNETTLEEILGCSPDELDSLVLMCYALSGKVVKAIARATSG